MTNESQPAKVRTIRLTDAAYEIATQRAKRHGRSISEQVEFWILLAKYGERGAVTRLENRRKPGGRKC